MNWWCWAFISGCALAMAIVRAMDRARDQRDYLP